MRRARKEIAKAKERKEKRETEKVTARARKVGSVC